MIATLDQIQKGTRSMLSIVTTFWNALLKSFDAISTKLKSASVEISLIIWERKRINGKLHHAYE
jgi:hypothetical protein